MAKIIKKFLFFTRIELENGEVITPLEGVWYEDRQYYKGRLGALKTRIAPPVKIRNKVEGGWYHGKQFHNGRLRDPKHYNA